MRQLSVSYARVSRDRYRVVFECDVVNAPRNRSAATEGGGAARAYLVVPDARHIRLRRVHVTADAAVAAGGGGGGGGAWRRTAREACGDWGELVGAAAVVACVVAALVMGAVYFGKLLTPGR